jgi:hypothetical protein
MGEDLKAQLERLYPELANVPYSAGAKHPPYSNLNIEESYARFCQEMASRDYTDERGTVISILEVNFPKLLNLKLASNNRNAKASRVLDSLRKGEFDASIYTYERDRITTLFWIPQVISDCDAIHPNAHPLIQGDEVYLKRYDKEGAQNKLVFVDSTYAGQRVVTTSFLVTPERLCKFLKFPPIWQKN